MTRTLSAIALLVAIAGPAAAQEARVNVAGMDEAAARQQIRQAAQTVCQAANRQGSFQGAYTVQNCLSDGESRGMAQYRAYRAETAAAARPNPTAMARNDNAAPDRGE